MQKKAKQANEREFKYQVRKIESQQTEIVLNRTLNFNSICSQSLFSFANFQQIMRNLVRRYVTVEQRKAESQGVTEDDVNEIKQDISAFRCEIVEILKGSGMNTSIVSGQGTGKRCDDFHIFIFRVCVCIFNAIDENSRQKINMFCRVFIRKHLRSDSNELLLFHLRRLFLCVWIQIKWKKHLYGNWKTS